jgi:hypothetical protein
MAGPREVQGTSDKGCEHFEGVRMIANLEQILSSLEQQDVHDLLSHGMSVAVEGQIRDVCVEYVRVSRQEQEAIKSKITRKAVAVFGIFITRMATLAMQARDTESLDIGLTALDISNIVDIDSRDAYGAIGRLAFAAKRCDVSLADRAKLTIPNASLRLLELFEHPKQPRVTRDQSGNLVFWSAWSNATRRNATQL